MERSGRRSANDALLEQVFTTHYGGLCRLATLLVGDPAAAEDVVQEAFLRTFSSWWRLRQPERAQFYVRTTVVNLCRSRLRRRRHEQVSNLLSWDPAPQGGEPTEDALVVAAALRTLPPRQREAVVLRYYGDLNEQDVARVLGCSVGTVKSQLARARATLARRLAEPASSTGTTDARD